MSTINTNLQALTAAMNLDRNQTLLGQSIDRLSSGSSILSPADNPAGLADSDSLGADGERLSAASSNVQNAISYTQAADSNLSSMGSILDRMSQLSTLAQDPTANASDTGDYEQEFQSLQSQLRSMIGGSSSAIGGSSVTDPSSTFNGTVLFGSTAAGGITLDIGDSSADQLTIPDMDLQSGPMVSMIQQDSGGTFTLSATDPGATASINSAIQQVASERATLGAAQTTLNLASSTLQVQQQNVASAVSNISDVDVAQESTQLAKYNILAQAGASMLVQANQSPQSVLKLLQN
jgi:flagellin